MFENLNGNILIYLWVLIIFSFIFLYYIYKDINFPKAQLKRGKR